MRHYPTPSEFVLWQYLRAQKLGVPFRRQQVVGRHIVDFLSRKAKLVVEVDGGMHEHPEAARADRRRDRALERAGYRVLRLSAKLVLEETEAVVERVRVVVAERLAALGR